MVDGQSSPPGAPERSQAPGQPQDAVSLEIAQPDDWHLHLRDGNMLRSVAPHTATQFARAVVMPNLAPPVTTVQQALDYRGRILQALGPTEFQPLMTLYLTDDTSVEEVRRAAEHPAVVGFKLYPAGATTNSASGVRDLQSRSPIFAEMARCGLVLQVHGEVTHQETDIFDREAQFLEEVLNPLVASFSALRVVLEHITTRQGVEFVQRARQGVGGTLTAHHLLLNRNALFQGGIRPDMYCLPILKREEHRQSLLRAATSGSPRFFLGTDSAPHPRGSKHSACGCAGIYTAHAALELYALAFEQANALDQLEGFASFHGADFYGLPRNTRRTVLVREPWQVPAAYPAGQEVITPLWAEQQLPWRVVAAVETAS